MKKTAILLILCMLLFSLQMFVSCSEVEEPTPTQPSETEATPTEKPTKKPTQKPTEKVEDGKEIDIYIIAGQSNASGYTGIDWTVLESLWSDCKIGSNHVLYAGKAEYDDGKVNKYQEIFWENAKGGQGIGKNSMGAEAGMAKKLAEEYYNKETGKTAGIIKFAHGGTSLLNKTTGSNAINGNWVSPSYAEELGIRFANKTGGLYRLLLEQIKKNVGQLARKGYSKVNFKGLFWMQGEADKNEIAEYKKAFKFFVNDLRDDLATMFGDETLYDLPVIVGEISKTSGGADAGTVAKNEAFIAMQRELAEMYEVYTIASGQYEITTWDASAGVSVNDPKQKDAWHWNTANMFAIGELVGECILENILTDKQ